MYTLELYWKIIPNYVWLLNTIIDIWKGHQRQNFK